MRDPNTPPPLRFLNFLLSGVSLNPSDIIWPIQALCWLLPYRWCISALVYSVYSKIDNVPGTASCTYNGPGAASNATVMNGTFSYCKPSGINPGGEGFYCPELPPSACFGPTGLEAVASISNNFHTFTTDSTRWPVYTLYALLFALAFKLSFFVGFSLICTRGIATPKSGPSKGNAEPVQPTSNV